MTSTNSSQSTKQAKKLAIESQLKTLGEFTKQTASGDELTPEQVRSVGITAVDGLRYEFDVELGDLIEYGKTAPSVSVYEFDTQSWRLLDP